MYYFTSLITPISNIKVDLFHIKDPECLGSEISNRCIGITYRNQHSCQDYPCSNLSSSNHEKKLLLLTIVVSILSTISTWQLRHVALQRFFDFSDAFAGKSHTRSAASRIGSGAAVFVTFSVNVGTNEGRTTRHRRLRPQRPHKNARHSVQFGAAHRIAARRPSLTTFRMSALRDFQRASSSTCVFEVVP